MRQAGPDGVDVSARCQPVPLEHGCRGAGGRHDDPRVQYGRSDRIACRHPDARGPDLGQCRGSDVGGELGRPGRRRARDPDFSERPGRGDRHQVRSGLHAGAHDREHVRSGHGEQLGGDGGNRRGPDLGHGRRVQHGERLSCLRLDSSTTPWWLSSPIAGIAGRDVDRLEAVPDSRLVGRHQRHQPRRPGRLQNRAQRLEDLAACPGGQRRAHGVRAARIAEHRADRAPGQHEQLHRLAPFVPVIPGA